MSQEQALGDALRLYDSLPHKARLDLIELLVRRAALSSPSFLGSAGPGEQDSANMTVTAARPESDAAPTAADSSAMTHASSSSSLTIKAPTPPPPQPHHDHDPSIEEDAWTRIAATVSTLQLSREASLNGASKRTRSTSTSRSRQRSMSPLATSSSSTARNGGEFVRPGADQLSKTVASLGGSTDDVPRGRGKDRVPRKSKSQYLVQKTETLDSILIRTPDEVRPVLEALRRIQQSEAGLLFEGIEVSEAGAGGKEWMDQVRGAGSVDIVWIVGE
ncbi:hypothetical protein HK104_008615 [Borealophlyctis nickersoniae]|nr:hypothetical protein HK104_008615 [Borealophlyctis nickersoniae]